MTALTALVALVALRFFTSLAGEESGESAESVEKPKSAYFLIAPHPLSTTHPPTAGHGGAAALVEMEELMGEHPALAGDAFTVHRSPCMRLCGHGPSVRLHVTLELDKDGPSKKVSQCTLAVEHLMQVRRFRFSVWGLGLRAICVHFFRGCLSAALGSLLSSVHFCSISFFSQQKATDDVNMPYATCGALKVRGAVCLVGNPGARCSPRRTASACWRRGLTIVH